MWSRPLFPSQSGAPVLPDVHPDECVFCRRVRRGEFGHQIRNCVAFAPLNPVAPGHMLVIPREHVPNATSDPEISASVMYAAATIARTVGYCNIITSVGIHASQTVNHLHLHIVPRFPNDGLHLPWSK